MRKIKFKQDFATRKKDEVVDCESMTSANLVRRGIAEYAKKAEKKAEKEEKNGELEELKQKYFDKFGEAAKGRYANDIEYLTKKIEE